MACDLCGGPNENFTAQIEGTNMTVCNKCSTYGKNLKPIQQTQKPQKQKKPTNTETETITTINPNYAKKIRETRQNQKLTQDQLAQKIGEKTSTLKKIETGNTEPTIQIAEKLQKTLKINLIKEETQESINPLSSSNKNQQTLTLGDFIKKRKH